MEEGIQGQRRGTTAAAPSLLRGLVFDENGNRFTPSHAVKRGKRYRYYVSQLVIKDAKSAPRAAARIPARELESVVLGELKGFLASPDRVASALADASGDLVTTQTLIESARRVVNDLDSKPHEPVKKFLSATVGRIVLHKESVEIQIKRNTLHAILLDPNRAPATGSAQQSLTEEELLVLDVPTKFRRCRGEMRLIIPSPGGAREPRKPIPSLVKAIARAQDWVRAIIAGEYRDQRAIAAGIGVNEWYVCHVIAGAFLAPRIVEAIAIGRELPEMTLPALLKNASLRWKEQCERLAEFTVN